jgi:hypothetical protein
MSLRYLKVKIKSLAAEAQIIRKEERKAKSAYHYSKGKQGLAERFVKDESEFFGLRNHRKFDVRSESRAALVAYGYLRGKSYQAIENPDEKNPPKWDRVFRLAEKYGGLTTNTEDKIKEWRGY